MNGTRARIVRHRIAAEATSSAPPAEVFALLRESDTWPAWSFFDACELEHAGRDEPFGVGAIRVFVTRATRAREQVTELIPDRKLSYVLLSGLPLHDYRGEVILCPLDTGGTLIHWAASFESRLGTGWFWRRFIRRTLATIAAQLAAAAEPTPPHAA